MQQIRKNHLRLLVVISFLMTSVTAFSSLFATTASAQNHASPDFKTIDAYVQTELQSINMPGAALGVVQAWLGK